MVTAVKMVQRIDPFRPARRDHHEWHVDFATLGYDDLEGSFVDALGDGHNVGVRGGTGTGKSSLISTCLQRSTGLLVVRLRVAASSTEDLLDHAFARELAAEVLHAARQARRQDNSVPDLSGYRNDLNDLDTAYDARRLTADLLDSIGRARRVVVVFDDADQWVIGGAYDEDDRRDRIRMFFEQSLPAASGLDLQIVLAFQPEYWGNPLARNAIEADFRRIIEVPKELTKQAMVTLLQCRIDRAVAETKKATPVRVDELFSTDGLTTLFALYRSGNVVFDGLRRLLYLARGAVEVAADIDRPQVDDNALFAAVSRE